MSHSTRRIFLGNVGETMLLTSLGSGLTATLGVAQGGPARLVGSRDLERLVALVLETPLERVQEKIVGCLREGTSMHDVVGATALANARTFGGTDYDGYHAFMALEPALTMAGRMPEATRALPLLKVIYRTKARMLQVGDAKKMSAVAASDDGDVSASTLRARVLSRDMQGAERIFRRIYDEQGLDAAYDQLQPTVQTEIDVHQTVLAWRAYDMLRFAGKEHGWELLRTEVRQCVDREQRRVGRGRPEPGVRRDIPAILNEHKVLEIELGTKRPDDTRVAELVSTIFRSGRREAAEAVACALKEGWDPEVVGEAISVAACDYTLHERPNPRKRNGVHGASIGVHAADTANAWRNIARVSRPATQLTSLVIAAYHTGGQDGRVSSRPIEYVERAREFDGKDTKARLDALDSCIRDRDLLGASAAMHAYLEAGGTQKSALALCMRYAVANDGALHAEKYFKTALEELPRVRAAFRPRRLIALARVTASLAGEPAPGLAQAKRLLSRRG